MKPRVFIAMASTILGGPGKGLVQFLRHGGLEGIYPLMVAYSMRPEKDTEYIAAMRATGAPVAVLRQRRTLDPWLVPQALELIARHKITVLQSHGYKSHVLCWLLRHMTGLPWVAFVHGWTSEDIKIRLYAGLEQAMLLLADKVVAVSDSLRRSLLPSVRRRCLIIPNAVSLEEPPAAESGRALRTELGFPQGALIAGVVGRFSPEKGHAVFLHALAEAAKIRPELHALLVGDGQERDKIRHGIRELGLEGRCALSGHVRKVTPYYACMDMLVMPSFREGMPNAALEAMAMGLPVIASRVGGIPEVVAEGETGILLPPGDAAALADGLARLASDPDARKRMGLAGKQRVAEQFTPAVRTERFFRLYADLLMRK